MKFVRTDPFKKDWQKLPEEIKERARKSLRLLAADLRYPSLRAKKLKSREDVWEARITKGYRFTFQIVGDTYILRSIGKHEEALRKR
jgi:mRNA interferase RelE/StbE